MTPEKSNYLLQSISSLFIFLFVYTALSKFHQFTRFEYVLGKSPLIGSFNLAAAWSIPILELAVSLLLLIPGTRKVGFYAALGLMSIFSAYVCFMLLFVPDLPCSCGGVIQKMSWKQHLIFNLVFTTLAFWGTRLAGKKKTDRPSQAHAVFT